MLRYLCKRLLQTILVLFLVMTIVFVILRVIGDPVKMMITPNSTFQDMENLRHILGLDESLPIQYVDYIKNIFHGDFGTSYYFDRPVIELIAERLPATLKIGGLAILISVPIAIGAGILSAIKRNSVWDNIATTFVVVGRSLPTFWFGLILILFFSVKLGWLPASGYGTPAQLVMPVIAMAIGMGASTTRLTRSSMLEVMRQDYIVTARSKGVAENAVIVRHGLHNALLSVITFIALQIGYTFAGSVVIESVFGLPGIGRLIVTAIKNYDFPLVQASALIFALIFSVINCLADICYTLVDPRISYR